MQGSKGLCVKGSWRPNITATHILTPTLMAIGVVSFSFTWCSTGGPGAQLSAECWLALQHLVSNSSDLQLTDFLSSLSYIIVQSPTQSLEWHVWSSSSGNNCHAVQRSLSSGASVYECIMGFYLVPFRQPNPPTRFFSIACHWDVSLPSGASLWNGMFGRVEGQNTTTAVIGIHPTKAWLSQLVNFKNPIWTWGHIRRTICNKIVL